MIFRLEGLKTMSCSNRFKLIKTTHWCLHSSARKLKSKKWLAKRKFESSEVSILLITTLKLESKTQKTQKCFQDLTFQKTCFNWESWKFQSFQVFSSGSHTKIKKSDMFLRLVNFKEFLLSEEVGTFQDFWVFYFGPYTEFGGFQVFNFGPLLKSKTLKLRSFWTLANFTESVLLEVRNFRGFQGFYFGHYIELETRKTFERSF